MRYNLVQLSKYKSPGLNLVKLSCWCTASINGKKIRVRVRHVGRGRFLVIEAEGTLDRAMIDAADILHCET